VTLNITGLPDQPTKRYITDSLRTAIPNTTFNATQTPTGLNVTIDPVDDPKALADRLTFGTTKVSGWTISVTAKKIDLPPPTEQEVEQALKDLKSTDGRAQHAAADRMAKCYTVLASRREEVAKALGAIITETTKAKDNPWVFRGAVMNALKMWAGPENVPGLVAYLEWTLEGKPFPQSEGDAIAILAKLKDPSSAAVLAKYLPNGFVRGTVANALKAIGPAAEKAVIPLLEHKDGWTVREACFVLKEIGTKQAVEPLKKVIDKKDGFISDPANEALQAVSKRN
jgi:hypothetical protein